MSSPKYLSLFFFFLFALYPACLQACESHKFTNSKTFENCVSLPAHDSLLHWTYDFSKWALSMAFTAQPTEHNGWVAWALNPTASGMVGAQALLAFCHPNGTVSVSTYDIQSYHAVTQGPISYNVSDISTEVADGKISIFATWMIPNAGPTLNQVWQVGPVVNGKPIRHDFKPENLESKGKLSLSTVVAGGGALESPAEAPGNYGAFLEALEKGSGEDLVSMMNVGLGLVLGLGALMFY